MHVDHQLLGEVGRWFMAQVADIRSRTKFNGLANVTNLDPTLCSALWVIVTGSAVETSQ